jgi:hypothetical protein
LVQLLDQIPVPPRPRSLGRPHVYSDRLFLKALVIMIVRCLATVHALLAILEQPRPEMQQLRFLLTEEGRYPSRRTWERRLNALPATLPDRLLGPAAASGRGDRPRSGFRWRPTLPRANAADNEQAPALIRHLPEEVRYVLGDFLYNDPALRQLCTERSQELVTTRRGAYPHTDGGVEVRRVFHKLRPLAMENFNEHFKAIFGVHGSVPTRGLRNTQRSALGAILVYQLALLYRHEHGLDLNAGLKPFLQAA